MIDSGCADDWTPSNYLRQQRVPRIDYLFITNADQDHMNDLQSLDDAGIPVTTLFRNKSYSGDQMRAIKRVSGPLTRDAGWYCNACDTYNAPVSEPFETYMGGITQVTFYNSYPVFRDTNNLSLTVFLKFAGFQIFFPGDLEEKGWEALLAVPSFRAELANTTILVASHHGRESGYCEDVFNYCSPRAVVMSDKAIVHDTQNMGQTYRGHVIAQHPNGVVVRTTNRQRHVLTTRNDGHIHFIVSSNGNFTIDTEYAG